YGGLRANRCIDPSRLIESCANPAMQLLQIWDRTKQNHVDLANRVDKIILYGLIDRKFGSSRQHNISSCRTNTATDRCRQSLHEHPDPLPIHPFPPGTGACALSRRPALPN
ncbi:MAG: hypothetical protein J0H21_07165, partial [Rhizobiales bacterium]|nr:hypothetical protein [Hyphomicrobiales bacterium]